MALATRFADSLTSTEAASMMLDTAMKAADHHGYRDRQEFFSEVLQAPCWHASPPMEQLLHFWQHDFPKCAVAHPDAVALLRQLRERGLRVGLITNGKSSTQNGKIEFLKLRGHFDHVIVSGDVGVDKPDPAIFDRCVRQMGIAPHEAVYVGDHAENDVRGATAAGLHAIWISTGGPWPAHLPPPERRIDSLRELPDAIDRLGNG